MVGSKYRDFKNREVSNVNAPIHVSHLIELPLETLRCIMYHDLTRTDFRITNALAPNLSKPDGSNSSSGESQKGMNDGQWCYVEEQ